jgi:uncharacterized protein (DUF1800 family)
MKPWRGPFGEAEAAHLLGRAVFAAAPGDVARALGAGLDATVDALLDAPLPPPTEIERSLRASNDRAALAAAILHRLVTSTAPLRENLALFFHNHFVSALGKVVEGRMMLDQFALFREMALGPFADLVKGVARDPAMVRYLDLERSSRGEPNENFARELFELFTTGPGPYDEQDIREAARAFTGHHLRNGRFVFSEAAHDPGSKTVLGRTGAWTGDDVAAIAADHPATATFVAAKLARHFIADEPPAGAVHAIAAAWIEHGGDVGRVVRAILTSEAFFAPEHRLAVTRSPAALVAGAARGAGCRVAPLAAARHCFAMGQALLDPPTVKGYPGGRRWLNAATLLARRTFLLEALAEGRRAGTLAGDVASVAAEGGARLRVELLLLHPDFQRC